MEVLKLHTAILRVEIENLRSMIEELEGDVETGMLLADPHGVVETASSLEVELDERGVDVG
jgi:hypothetical protein